MHTELGLVLTGLVAGFFGGLLGIGGGVIKVPILTIAFGMPMHLAMAVSLISNVFIAAAAAHRYWRRKMIVFSVVFRVMVWAIVAALFGVLLANRLPEAVVKKIFAFFMLWVMVDILRPRNGGSEVDANMRPTLSREAGVGVPMGFLAGLLGIGGGVIAVPLGRRLLGLPMKNAIACSVALIIPSSFAAAALCLYTRTRLGYFDVAEPLWVNVFLVPGSIVGAQLGAYTAIRIKPVYIRYIFAAIQPLIFYKMWSS